MYHFELSKGSDITAIELQTQFIYLMPRQKGVINQRLKNHRRLGQYRNVGTVFRHFSLFHPIVNSIQIQINCIVKIAHDNIKFIMVLPRFDEICFGTLMFFLPTRKANWVFYNMVGRLMINPWLAIEASQTSWRRARRLPKKAERYPILSTPFGFVPVSPRKFKSRLW